MATEDYAIAMGSGALSGAAAGSFAGPWGAAVGGVIGAGLGFFGASQAEDQEAEAKRLARRQRRKQKNLRAKQRSVERRALAQETEASSRGAKSDMTIPSPKVSTAEIALQQSMAIGTGSPFDTYIIRTYGQPQNKMS
tara:strand:- start:512 stop:925 length:414 start_codon:yes stop_codon:yes gene_type:complete